MPTPYESVRQPTEEATRLRPVNVGISTVKIAQGLAETTLDGLEDIPLVSSSPRLSRGHRKPEFKRHVESRSRRRTAVKLDTRQVSFTHLAQSQPQASLRIDRAD